jgi:class 3 adenylate cyclase/alpha-beta hydrolase superfamily lysophospholipase
LPTLPETIYTQNGDISLAYQIVGSGPLDLVLVPGFISHLEYGWEEPSYARFLNRLASFCRLIIFDKRGTGLSDQVDGIPTLEQRMDDIRIVMDNAGCRKAAILGVSEGGAIAALFAATYPERTSSLIFYGGVVRKAWAPNHPWGMKPEDAEVLIEQWHKGWGGPINLENFAPSMVNDQRFRLWWAKFLRLSASPASVVVNRRMVMEIDIREILPTLHVPTLVLHRTGDKQINIEEGRYVARQIPDAKFVELNGDDHFWWVGDSESIVNEIELFLTGERQVVEPDRVLATLLFTDIVDSTNHAAKLGDRHWRDLIESHDTLMRNEIARFRGRIIKSTGDGVLATFDGPARAIHCAVATQNEVQKLGIEIRAGLHTGEVELMENDLGGIAVHLAARVMAQAQANEIWLSRTVKDLVVGSGFKFRECGAFDLKGIPGTWDLFILQG